MFIKDCQETAPNTSQPLVSVENSLHLFAPNQLLSAAELWALTAEGLIDHVVGNVFIAAHTHLTPKIKAFAITKNLLAAVRNKIIIGHKSAAWIWDGCPEPETHCVLYTTEERITLRKEIRHFKIYHRALELGDVRILYPCHKTTSLQVGHGFAKVTSFERTIYDLLFQTGCYESIDVINRMFTRNPHQFQRKARIYQRLEQRILPQQYDPKYVRALRILRML